MEAEEQRELEAGVVALLAVEVDLQGVEAVVLRGEVAGQIVEAGEVVLEAVLEVVLEVVLVVVSVVVLEAVSVAVSVEVAGVGADVVVVFEGHNHQIQSTIFFSPFSSAVELLEGPKTPKQPKV